MNIVASKIFDSKKVIDADGVEHDFHSSTSLKQCEYLQSIINEIDASRCLEVGLAFGMSSMFICEAIQLKKDRVFYSIDPQQEWWVNIGLKNLNESGYSDFIQFYRDYSGNVLPKLLSDDVKLDFAYVDTTKIFDVVLNDVYYLTRLLKKGGILVLDDCDFLGLNKLSRYVAKMPHFNVHSLYDSYSCGLCRNTLAACLRHTPGATSIFSDKVLFTDSDLGVNARCVAFQKVSEDERDWNWYSPF